MLAVYHETAAPDMFGLREPTTIAAPIAEPQLGGAIAEAGKAAFWVGLGILAIVGGLIAWQTLKRVR